MTSSPHLKKSVFSSWNKIAVLLLLFICLQNSYGQYLAAYHDNQNRFYIFDKGKTIQAEYLPVTGFSIGGRCILYTDNRNQLKMYYNGEISTLEVNMPETFKAFDYLSVYSYGGIVKIIDKGRTVTISTNSVKYSAMDSLVTFYDISRQLLAVYYKGHIKMLEDGLAGMPDNIFRAGDNVVAYVSSRTKDFKIFYRGQTQVIEPFLSGGTFKAGQDIVAFINNADQKFRMFYKGEVVDVEDFPPESFQVGDAIAAYVDHSGSFRVFSEGEAYDIASFRPDFYKVVNGMILYGEKGYFKVWYNDRIYTLETFTPGNWQAEWNTIVYKDLNGNVKVFSKGESKVLTYDLVESVNLYRDLILVNKGMSNYNVYWEGKKY